MTHVVTKRLLFVGENRSLTAQRQGWTWEDGRLAAKPLFEALRAMGVEPTDHMFMNLWLDSGAADDTAPGRIRTMKRTAKLLVVALGAKVSKALTAFDIDHVAIVHPAARGKIRKRERYVAHVAERLGPAMRGRP